MNSPSSTLWMKKKTGINQRRVILSGHRFIRPSGHGQRQNWRESDQSLPSSVRRSPYGKKAERNFFLLQLKKAVHSAIVERSNVGRAETQSLTLQADVLRRMPDFKMRIPITAISVFRPRARWVRRNQDDRACTGDPVLPSRGTEEVWEKIATPAANERILPRYVVIESRAQTADIIDQQIQFQRICCTRRWDRAKPLRIRDPLCRPEQLRDFLES
jgi:hypothetical protein